jgi:hypothetical protein
LRKTVNVRFMNKSSMFPAFITSGTDATNAMLFMNCVACLGVAKMLLFSKGSDRTKAQPGVPKVACLMAPM